VIRIDDFELVPFALPFEDLYVTARGSLERRETILLRLHTEDGATGLGEAVPLSLRGGPGLAEVLEALDRAAGRLRGTDVTAMTEGAPVGVAAELVVELAAGGHLPSPAVAALEMALFDLAGKITGEPVWRLLGAERAAPVVCNATLTAGAPDAVARSAARWLRRGFSSFKLKLGTECDVEQVAAVREAVGPGTNIRVDANGAWSADQAIETIGQISQFDIELVEQPCATLDEMAEVARSAEVSIAGDESIASEADAAAARRKGACELATAKLAKVGGIGQAHGIAGAIPTYLSSALDGPVGIAAAAHAAQALYRDRPDPGLAHGLATQLLFADTVAARQCESRDGALQLPEGPGLGVELDEAALARLRLGSGAGRSHQ
jgi:o-succinylbenzoate synthase